MHILFERGYNRVNKNLTRENYPPPAKFDGALTYSRSWRPYQRILKFSKPSRRLGNFNDIFSYGEFWRTEGATLHDGIEFVDREFPYLHGGEIVIGFPGMLRQNCSHKYVPLLIISQKELAWDEESTSIGWPEHWWRGDIL